jgi:hypothetical protein
MEDNEEEHEGCSSIGIEIDANREIRVDREETFRADGKPRLSEEIRESPEKGEADSSDQDDERSETKRHEELGEEELQGESEFQDQGDL